MTISRTVYNQLFEHSDASSTSEHVIRLRPTEAKAGAVVVSAKNKIQMWTQEEHERFLVALEMFPAGPWKKVADYIGTKTPRQTMTHAQKYRQKISRRQRGLRNQKKTTTSAPNSPHKRTIDTQAEYMKHAPQPAQSPYGVADVYIKRDESGKAYPPLHGVAMTHAAAAADPSAGRLDMLARAMQMQTEAKASAYAYAQTQAPQPSVEHAPAPEGSFLMPAPAPSSPSNASLPSLAQILNLRGSGAQPPVAPQTRPGCNCNCSCSPSTKTEPGCHPSPARQ